MTLSAVKTLALASALVLLGSLSNSVDARNQSVAAHHHKHAKAAKCEQCFSTLDLDEHSVVCYHQFPSHRNWFFGGYSSGSFAISMRCNCCNDFIYYRNEKPENWHLVYSKDVTWCHTTGRAKDIADKEGAKTWYDNYKGRCP